MPRNSKQQVGDNWAALLQAELANRGATKFPKNAIEFAQIREMRKKAKLPSGIHSTGRWVREQIKRKKIEKIVGYEKSKKCERLVRTIKYVVV